jgi:hypothetical protein
MDHVVSRPRLLHHLAIEQERILRRISRLVRHRSRKRSVRRNPRIGRRRNHPGSLIFMQPHRPRHIEEPPRLRPQVVRPVRGLDVLVVHAPAQLHMPFGDHLPRGFVIADRVGLQNMVAIRDLHIAREQRNVPSSGLRIAFEDRPVRCLRRSQRSRPRNRRQVRKIALRRGGFLIRYALRMQIFVPQPRADDTYEKKHETQMPSHQPRTIPEAVH